MEKGKIIEILIELEIENYLILKDKPELIADIISKHYHSSQTEMPSDEGNFKWYKLGANDEANELYDPINPEVSFNTRRQLTK